MEPHLHQKFKWWTVKICDRDAPSEISYYRKEKMRSDLAVWKLYFVDQIPSVTRHPFKTDDAIYQANGCERINTTWWMQSVVICRISANGWVITQWSQWLPVIHTDVSIHEFFQLTRVWDAVNLDSLYVEFDDESCNLNPTCFRRSYENLGQLD